MHDKAMNVEDPKPAGLKKVYPSKEDVFTLGQAVFNFNQYPALKDMDEGSDVSGSFKGKVGSKTDSEATVNWTELNLEPSQNSADMAVAKMTGRDNKPAPRSAMPDAEDEDM